VVNFFFSSFASSAPLRDDLIEKFVRVGSCRFVVEILKVILFAVSCFALHGQGRRSQLISFDFVDQQIREILYARMVLQN